MDRCPHNNELGGQTFREADLLRLGAIVLRTSTALLVVIATPFLCCFAAELTVPHYFKSDPVEIIGGYQMAIETGYGYVITMPPRENEDGSRSWAVIVTNVEALGWDDEFLLVKNRSVTGESIDWDIIIVATGQHYSCSEDLGGLREHLKSRGFEVSDMCVSYNEFLKLRERLGVPNTIEMQEAGEVYDRLSE